MFNTCLFISHTKCALLWLILSAGCLVTGLRDVRVLVPDAVRRGDNATLRCYFDLEGDSLYSVKWYKGGREFFRYTPIESPPMKIFPLPELHIEMSGSNSTQITLKNVVPSQSGRYSCEVSADAPSFHTALTSADMDVVEIPRSRPVLTGMLPRYRVGDTLRVNCTSSGSRPAANLTWVFNGQQVDAKHVKLYHVVRDPTGELETSTTRLELPLTSRDFTPHGRLKVRCTASLHSLYWQTTEKSAEEERPRGNVMHNDVSQEQELRPRLFSEDETEDVKERPFLLRVTPPSPAIRSGSAQHSSAMTVMWTTLLLIYCKTA